MELDYELNGNMEEARWKVTRHNPKYYRYGYDGLNRVTVANYGDILLTENPATKHVRFDSAQRTTLSTLQVIERSRNDRLPKQPNWRYSSGGDF